MKILIYGAGVLGSLYAARLKISGQEVTILARGQRLEEIRSHGIILENVASGQKTMTSINVVEQLAPDDAYDLVVVLMRKTQISAVLPILSANQRTPKVLFMCNNASGPDEMIDSLGRERVLLGFPGAGGVREAHLVRYIIVSGYNQATTFGELDGRTTQRLKQIAQAFKAAGFPVETSKNIDAWLKAHVAKVSPAANALYMAGGDNHQLARRRDALTLMVRAMREGFEVLRELNIPILPSKLKLVEWLPEPMVVFLMRIMVNSKEAEITIAGHANAARDEMRQIADEFKELARTATISTPAMDRLYSYI